MHVQCLCMYIIFFIKRLCTQKKSYQVWSISSWWWNSSKCRCQVYITYMHSSNFQMTAIETPSGGEQCNPRYQYIYKLVTFIICVTISTIIHILHIWETKYNWYTQLCEICIRYIASQVIYMLPWQQPSST